MNRGGDLGECRFLTILKLECVVTEVEIFVKKQQVNRCPGIDWFIC